MRKIDKLDVIHIKKKADTYIKKNTENQRRTSSVLRFL